MVVRARVNFRRRILGQFGFGRYVAGSAPMVVFILFFVLRRAYRVKNVARGVVSNVIVVTVLVVGHLNEVLFSNVLVCANQARNLYPAVSNGILTSTRTVIGVVVIEASTNVSALRVHVLCRAIVIRVIRHWQRNAVIETL